MTRAAADLRCEVCGWALEVPRGQHHVPRCTDCAKAARQYSVTTGVHVVPGSGTYHRDLSCANRKRQRLAVVTVPKTWLDPSVHECTECTAPSPSRPRRRDSTDEWVVPKERDASKRDPFGFDDRDEEPDPYDAGWQVAVEEGEGLEVYMLSSRDYSF